jgi:hypothetical protein
MSAASARGLAASGTVLALTGIALGAFRFVVPAADPFSAYPHPWWKHLVMVHVLATPAFFFFVGSVWWRHVVRQWKNRKRRASGVSVVVVLAAVAASGYLLYFVASERGLDLTRAVHSVAGVLATVLYTHHAVVGWRAARRRTRALR